MAKILDKATNISANLQTAILTHKSEDKTFNPAKQQPDVPNELPRPIAYKDGSWQFDWTPGQESRYWMEELRQQIHQLQGAGQGRGLDVILPDAREMWKGLRDIMCREYPGGQYFDLDGFENYCPEASRPAVKKK